MTVKEFMHRWVLGCANKPLFYLPFHREFGKVIIEPMSHIYSIEHDNKQFFAPFCDRSQLTGTIRIKKGIDYVPTIGCEYRIYKKVKKPSGKYEYISVLENGVLDPNEKGKMFKNKAEINLPVGTYYYKEFISGEGDILHFDIEKFEVTANDTTNVIIDHEPKLVQTFFKFVKETEHFDIIKTSGGKPSPDGYGEYGGNTTSFGGSFLFNPSYTKYFNIGTTDSLERIEYIFNLRSDLDVHCAGITQEIKESPNEKICPEFTAVIYMGKDFSNPLRKKNVTDDSKRKVWFNLARNEYAGTISGGAGQVYNDYYMDFYNVSLSGNTKANPDWYYGDILIHTGYLMMYHDYQIFNQKETYQNLYINENYISPEGIMQLTTDTYQGFYITTPYLQLSRNNELKKYFYQGYVPVECQVTEESKYANDTIYVLEITSPIRTISNTIESYGSEGSIRDYAYNINIKQGTKNYYCEMHHREETLYFLDDNDIIEPQLIPTDSKKTVITLGGGVARGYAAAEDMGGASMWICKAATATDPDTDGGYSPPYALPNEGLYLTVTLYFYEDGRYRTIIKTYNVAKNLLFPTWSPHKYKQAEDQYVYSQLEEHKDCIGACNCAVVFVRQTREHYRDWFEVKEPDD